MDGISVTLYWKNGEFFVSVGGKAVQLSPWVGVQLEEWRDNGRDWRRDDMALYEPVDLLNYLERTGQHLRRSKRLKAPVQNKLGGMNVNIQNVKVQEKC